MQRTRNIQAVDVKVIGPKETLEFRQKVVGSKALWRFLAANIMAAALRAAQGSATVAIITAAGIMAPSVKNIPGYSPEMLVMATAAGGTILSHVNDAGFWCVKEYLGMSVPDTLRSWTLLMIFTSLLGFGTMLLVQAVWF